MHIHLVGVAGTGMGSLAGMLIELGHRVSGSDVAFHAPMGPKLRMWGVKCLNGFSPAHLVPSPDLTIIGNVCRADNPEALEVRRRGLPFTHLAGALQRFALGHSHPLVVAGTHGKTTTSSLCAWLLESASLTPGFFIGGIPSNFGRGFRAPEAGGPFVIEGDEYDTAYFEKTAKFLHYCARHAILTSIEHDHIDIYPTAASYLAAFESFVCTLSSSDSVLVANRRDENVVKVVTEHQHTGVSKYQLEWYSTTPDASARWVARGVETSNIGQSFDLVCDGKLIDRFGVPLCGRHNLENSMAALIACHRAYGASFADLKRGLACFQGSQRRQQLLDIVGGVRLYDDFAHHPTAVRETLAGLRAKHPTGKLIAVFEPRSATACRRLHQALYPKAFATADRVILAPVGRANLAADERLDTQLVATEVRREGKWALATTALDQIVDQLVAVAQPGDTVVLLSNGDFGGIAGKLLAALSTTGRVVAAGAPAA